MVRVFSANRVRLIKKRYRIMSSVNLESLLGSVDTQREVDLIKVELKRRNED